MSDRYPCGSLKRRGFLGAAASWPFAASLLSSSSSFAADEAQSRVVGSTSHHGPKIDALGKFAAPGLYPGRVVEVKNPAMIRNGARSREAVKATLDRGLKELTGAGDATAAWRTFFEPGDVVGIKVVPNGQPYAHSSFELVLETIEGLKAAGVKPGDIFVYDRYRQELLAAGYDKILPAGIRFGGLTADGGDQLALDFEGFRGDPIAGYDKDAFVWMDLVNYGDNPKDERAYRSHLGKFVTKVVNKIVAIPVLKDHGSAGVTGALKNMSHGSVNNVARSHTNTFTNVCNQFIPQVVTHPVIRSKFVLQIMDGIRGVYQGGPFADANSQGKWTWEYNALLLATDPVALDHIEWGIVDAKRVLEKLPPVAASGKSAIDPLGTEGFDVRQPQHIALAGALGMGNFDLKSSPRGRRHLVQHSVVNL
ncbi:MAG: DUF362 domain-containing protein [Paludisphaera borealis]|uniref:DUF362 domain-containing protein n=1 Tax=Paludisphaera borealis TaxID=1387353 RepID=UPI00284E24DE|nr:DUF362 domain-containing protein [Paludisphaera borealis]MDR3622268.1 DUF362 domain-containing protein [Paludisphaera borealis]